MKVFFSMSKDGPISLIITIIIFLQVGKVFFFYVNGWSDIIDHNNNCFSTSGETCGIAFVVDSCIWSELYGWECGCGSERTMRELYSYDVTWL